MVPVVDGNFTDGNELHPNTIQWRIFHIIWHYLCVVKSNSYKKVVLSVITVQKFSLSNWEKHEKWRWLKTDVCDECLVLRDTNDNRNKCNLPLWT
jgi:hypothetical protein